VTASTHFVKNGEPTDDRYRAAIGPLATMFGSTLAKEFGSKKLKALREFIIQRQYCPVISRIVTIGYSKDFRILVWRTSKVPEK